MNAETSVYIAFGFVALMLVMLAAVVAMLILDAALAWTPKPRPRHAARRSPGQQYWARSVETRTAEYALVPERRWTR